MHQRAITELGEYRLEEVVGVGRMGAVHRAVDRRTGSEVAVKVLHDHIAADDHHCRRFEREAALLATLRHPNVIPIFDAGCVEDQRYLVTPLLSGRTLKHVIASGPLDPAHAVAILEAVAGALDAAHAAGIVHRDVKPGNVLLGHDGTVFLADFGLAGGGRSAEQATLTAPGTLIGTIDYMAPEHLDGAACEPAADVYALACMAIETLTGEVPFPRETTAAVMLAHVAHAPPSVCERRPDLPAALDDVLAAGMAKDPADRPGTAGDLAAGMRLALGAPDAPILATG
jgi:serine/threonine kinase PknH